MKKVKLSKEMKIIKSGNDMLRSAYQVALREGKDTNWKTFKRALWMELKKQHTFMLAKKMFNSESHAS